MVMSVDTGFSATLELRNSGAEEADELQVNNTSNGILYYGACRPAHNVANEVVED